MTVIVIIRFKIIFQDEKNIDKNYLYSLYQSKPKGPLFINFCSWKRVPEPKSPQDAVPVTGTSISQEKDDKGLFG